ncbi:16S rRNA (uracil(1498)-N(3))-methyltransferase [Ehrlichia ruminantium]|uniref:16S rRNA (uracil(1498)-N(3))-methyltransferase n=1 Tax=Ehrlichia ruminantium TaxID=779 RepID=UPI0015DBFE57|nr:16S rRNA (uracil(1498)-N(3))-methyltransferase [Ehrlichia ruminantium]QLK50566.1 16S rRNA (uracil(1498)-N(3))-methyltransferase [Ehrlichia ruminantium]QLK51491.1 16S rRNA (uracil(1498)-N(3))-methyltransferase [Ehrlichia ruminantium]QLK53326.1 16S rRNA (uracil(1498)-N(3))-methyltransferase [Ehrlichia ruminantium]QLK58826.1 16S rRNA (uracil(1498)-N(3))-methyltransferase [Ehrlichia ruminantium]UOD97488.1 16S rRNA (uracil(1498)-N(3))-methyltransferase [Ehrlichia ruminantium]
MHNKLLNVRLYVPDSISKHSIIKLDTLASHYISKVMRATKCDHVKIFNGKDGEWIGEICELSNNIKIRIDKLTRKQVKSKNLTLCFGIVKGTILPNIIRQATEMGVTLLQPIYTKHIATSNINLDKCRKWAIEASEQCERLDIPQISHPISFTDLKKLDTANINFIICDETGNGKKPAEILTNKNNIYIIVGPEGGFSSEELNFAYTFCNGLSLGTRILRVDTAVVSALAYVNEYYYV